MSREINEDCTNTTTATTDEDDNNNNNEPSSVIVVPLLHHQQNHLSSVVNNKTTGGAHNNNHNNNNIITEFVSTIPRVLNLPSASSAVDFSSNHHIQTLITFFLLSLTPITFVLNFLNEASSGEVVPDGILFLLAGLSLIPLAEKLSYLTEQVADQTNPTLGGLLNATFGNAPELLISLSALNRNLVRLVQLTLLGSILANLTFVLGCAILIGGLRFKNQNVDCIVGGSGAVVGMLWVSVGSIILPGVVDMLANTDESNSNYNLNATLQRMTNSTNSTNTMALAETAPSLRFSQVISFLMIVLYLGYILLTLQTHKDDNNDIGMSTTIEAADGPCYLWYFGRSRKSQQQVSNVAPFSITDDDLNDDESLVSRSLPQAMPFANDSPSKRTRKRMKNKERVIDDFSSSSAIQRHESDSKGKALANGFHHHVPTTDGSDIDVDVEIPLRTAVIWLMITALCVSFISDVLVNTIEDFSSHFGLSSVFTASILMPMFSNIAEQASACMFAFRNKMTLTLGVTLGSAIQISFFLFPGSVIYGYFTSQQMSLYCQEYETICYFVAVLTISFVIKGKTTNWFVGLLLIGLYIIISVGFIYHKPETLGMKEEYTD